MTLDEIGIKNATDKSSLGHGYLPYYELIFSRDGMMPRILEIGVQFGNSLKTWREYLGPDARIIGIDLVDNNIVDDLSPTEVWYGDAYTLEMVDRVWQQAPLDIIIDDGSHLVEHQQFVVMNYSKALTRDGVLIVEDIPGMDAIPRLTAVLPPGFEHAVVDFRTGRNTQDSILFMLWRK